jgi:hypothetical protein
VCFATKPFLSDIEVESEQPQRTSKLNRNNVRTVARRALLQLLEPLAGFVIDAGLGTNELHSMFRQAAVRSVASRQLEVAHRVNISGIAATTGIPRAEISRILKLKTRSHEETGDRQDKSTNRILTAWHQEPKFTNANGQPADLKLYGRGATFESLVRSHGRGIPTRAVLDELIRTRAVEVLPSQRIRAKAAMAVDRGISADVIRAFGERATALLSTMLLNMRRPDSPQFIASIFGSSIAPNALPLFRKELSNKSTEFLADIQESLVHAPISRSSKRDSESSNRVSVTVFYHESPRKQNKRKISATKKRRNFRRKSA